ncbi:hypothetical protein AMS68_002158 [Peltaster fructicola]|uniref:Uncharacterized protein n=1 Tax=Peltaster fructicola TaxID=286661 RepID=A0A6H0XPR3_9PEZI|nr:hypothetical protein AMS68_002158 [Peltaster fructicola]
MSMDKLYNIRVVGGHPSVHGDCLTVDDTTVMFDPLLVYPLGNYPYYNSTVKVREENGSLLIELRDGLDGGCCILQGPEDRGTYQLRRHYMAYDPECDRPGRPCSTVDGSCYTTKDVSS